MLANYRTGSVLSLCGLSGTGKTNLAMQLTYFAGYKTLYFGVDMSVFGFGDRLIKTKWYRENLGAIFPFGERTECDLQVERMAKTGKLKLDDGIRTYDCDSMTLEKIEYIAREEMKSFKADFVVIDYVGRIDSEKNVKDQWREDQAIARAIKGIAKRLDVRVISLVQFSSKAEKYKKPDFSWMSGSKEIISASDIVLCMWHDKKQGSAGDETDHSHIWVSDDIKSRDSGTHGNVRLETYGLWLYEGDL
jgi:replicative DNA helicase